MTHVVGAQGRRKILPSEPGKMALDDEDGAAAKLQMDARAFEKDAHGKYPCPHCFKTYLHGKHLKRHLMRRELTPPKSPETTSIETTGD